MPQLSTKKQKVKNVTNKMKKIQQTPIICTREVNENIRRVEVGQPLTRSLSILNQDCRFREKYEERDKVIHREEIKQEKLRKNKEDYVKYKRYYREYNKEYSKKPEVKARKKKYHRKYYEIPKNRAKHIERMKEYNKRPEVKARTNERFRERYKIPEFREKIKKYNKERYRKKHNLPKSKWKVE